MLVVKMSAAIRCHRPVAKPDDPPMVSAGMHPTSPTYLGINRFCEPGDRSLTLPVYLPPYLI